VPFSGVTGFDKEVGVCLRVARVNDSLKPFKHFKCEQSSTGSFVTYTDGKLAARLRSRSLSAVHRADA